jgi:hypothetical protein
MAEEKSSDGSPFFLLQMLSNYSFKGTDKELVLLLKKLFKDDKLDPELLSKLMGDQTKLQPLQNEPRDLFIIG